MWHTTENVETRNFAENYLRKIISGSDCVYIKYKNIQWDLYNCEM